VSPVFSINQEGTRARQAVIQCHTAALEVGQREDREADEGGHSYGKIPSCMEQA